MGPEGHVASIFPESPAVADERPVVAVRDCPKPPPTRVSLGFAGDQRGRGGVAARLRRRQGPGRRPALAGADAGTSCPPPGCTAAGPPGGCSTRPRRPSSRLTLIRRARPALRRRHPGSAQRGRDTCRGHAIRGDQCRQPAPRRVRGRPALLPRRRPLEYGTRPPRIRGRSPQSRWARSGRRSPGATGRAIPLGAAGTRDPGAGATARRPVLGPAASCDGGDPGRAGTAVRPRGAGAAG